MSTVVCVLALIALLMFPQHCAASARSALSVWGLDVVPSLFPYMVFSRVFAQRLQRRGFPAIVSVPLLGLLGGSPSGAGVISAYRGSLSRKKLLSLCALTGTISPMFLIGTVGSWTRDARLGLLLALCHISGAFLAAGCIAFFPARETPSPLYNQQCSEQIQIDPIRESISAVFSVGGYIVIFSVLAGVVSLLPCLPDDYMPIIHALLEAAGGMHALSVSPSPASLRAILLAGCSGFSGLSIIFQNLAFLRPLGVGLKHLLLFALLRAVFASALMALLYPLSMM